MNEKWCIECRLLTKHCFGTNAFSHLIYDTRSIKLKLVGCDSKRYIPCSIPPIVFTLFTKLSRLCFQQQMHIFSYGNHVRLVHPAQIWSHLRKNHRGLIIMIWNLKKRLHCQHWLFDRQRTYLTLFLRYLIQIIVRSSVCLLYLRNYEVGNIIQNARSITYLRNIIKSLQCFIKLLMPISSSPSYRWYPAKRALPATLLMADRALLAGHPRYVSTHVYG